MADSEEAGDDGSGDSAEESAVVDAWLEPLAGEVCGEDLEYDNDFLELSQAALGKPETQFAPAAPPDWRLAIKKAEALFERTRDLRIALLWARARVATEGWSSLPLSLRFVHDLLDRFWDDLHPRLDDGDAYARINAIAVLGTASGLISDLLQASIVRDRALGQVRGRDVELALERLNPRDGESPPSRAQIEQMLSRASLADAGLARLAPRATARLEALIELLRERVGDELLPDFDNLKALLRDVQQLMPSANADEQAAESVADESLVDENLADDGLSEEVVPRRAVRAVGHTGRFESREDAVRAIDMVCEYLERAEPTNPAQLLMRRAQRLMEKNFLQLVRELAPEALAEVARVMGVPVDSIASGDEST